MIDEDNYVLRTTDENGDVKETEMTAEQAFDFTAGKPIAFFPVDEQVLVDEDGTLIERESAIPQTDEEDDR